MVSNDWPKNYGKIADYLLWDILLHFYRNGTRKSMRFCQVIIFPYVLRCGNKRDRCIQNPAKHLRWIFFAKIVKASSRFVWEGSEYASVVMNIFPWLVHIQVYEEQIKYCGKKRATTKYISVFRPYSRTYKKDKIL